MLVSKSQKIRAEMASIDFTRYTLPSILAYVVAIVFLIVSAYTDLGCMGMGEGDSKTAKCYTLGGWHANSEVASNHTDLGRYSLSDPDHFHMKAIVYRTYTTFVFTAVIMSVACVFEVVTASMGEFMPGQRIFTVMLPIVSLCLSIILSSSLTSLVDSMAVASESIVNEIGPAADLSIVTVFFLTGVLALTVNRLIGSIVTGPDSHQV